jgi:hypothetical protein
MLRRLASEYNDRQAQWLANAVDSAGVTSAGADFLNLLWMDTAVSPQAPSSLPLYHLFDDMGLAYLRSSWQAGASVSAFKCGPFIGNHAVQHFSYDPGGGHVHPDAGAFQIFSRNDWLIVDDGYTWKTTSYQNTALVNGNGQIGEGGAWYNGSAFCMRPAQPEILFLQSTPLYDYAMADVKPAYPDSSRLTEFYRHFLYVRPDLWIVADELSADTASSFELYFHSDYPFAADSAGHFRVNGARARLFMDRLDGSVSSDSVFLQPLRGTGGSVTDTLPALRMTRTGRASAFFMNAFQAVSAGAARTVRPVYTAGAPPLLTVPLNDTALSFRVDLARVDRRAPLFVDLNAPAVEVLPALSAGALGFEAFAVTGGVRFSVRVPSSQDIRIEMFDAKGRIVLGLRGAAKTGINRFERRLRLSNGIYFARLLCKAGPAKRTVVLLK